jgi:hypothetical protein
MPGRTRNKFRKRTVKGQAPLLSWIRRAESAKSDIPEISGTIYRFYFFALEKTCNFVSSFRNNECDPLSPPEGEAACGEHPPDPLIFLDCFLRHYRYMGMPQRRGLKAQCAGAPRSDHVFLQIFPMKIDFV